VSCKGVVVTLAVVGAWLATLGGAVVATGDFVERQCEDSAKITIDDLNTVVAFLERYHRENGQFPPGEREYLDLKLKTPLAGFTTEGPVYYIRGPLRGKVQVFFDEANGRVAWRCRTYQWSHDEQHPGVRSAPPENPD